MVPQFQKNKSADSQPVSIVSSQPLNVNNLPNVTNTTANVNVHQASEETTVSNQVFPSLNNHPNKQKVCDSLADGPNRHTRPSDQKSCKCTPGWSGINCNLCQTDSACDPLMPQGMNGTCYKGGMTVNQNFQMCQVINRKIIDQLDPQVPEVTFSCHKENETCAFQCILL
jgi:hypothetical protein